MCTVIIMYSYGTVQYRTLETVLIILNTIITAQMLSIGGQNDSQSVVVHT